MKSNDLNGISILHNECDQRLIIAHNASYVLRRRRAFSAKL